MSKFRLLYLAPVFALIALGAWAFASPVGSSPDDDFHLASIWCANSGNTSACQLGNDAGSRKVPSALLHVSCYAHQPTESAACQTAYFDASAQPTALTSRGNFASNYPPVYYAAMSIFVGPDITTSVLVMRFANILIFIGMTTALFLLLPRERRPTLLWGWVISTVPLGLFLLASNNPSAWALIGIGSGWISLLGYFETRGRRKVALGALFALATIIAAGARADAALYAVLGIAVVVVLTFAKTKSYLMSAILPLALSALGVIFFVTSQQSGVVATGLADSGGGASGAPVGLLNLLAKDLMNVPSLWAGVFGTWGLGWLDTDMPAIVAFGGIAAFVTVVFVGLSRFSRRKAIALGLVALALWLIPTYVLVKGLNEVGQNVQPRYLLPLIVLAGGLAVLTVGNGRIAFTRVQIAIVAGILSLAQMIALYMNMRRYITGTNGHEWNLDVNKEWWWSMPISPMFVWIVGALAFTALLFVLAREMVKSDAIT